MVLGVGRRGLAVEHVVGDLPGSGEGERLAVDQEVFQADRRTGIPAAVDRQFDAVAERFGGALALRVDAIRRAADVDRKLLEALEYRDGPVVVVAEVVKEGNVFPMIPSGAPSSEMLIDPPKTQLEKPSGST